MNAMMPYLTNHYGNPDSLHSVGRTARKAVESARMAVARFISAPQTGILFTSGGSEANSLAVSGVLDGLRNAGKNHIITTKCEHHSVLEAVKNAEAQGFEITYLPADKNCIADISDLIDSCRPTTGLVSVMHVNNEIGSVQDIKKIGLVAHKFGALFHTDCVQSAGTHKIDVADIDADLLTISSHKIFGPKGAGCLYVKKPEIMNPIIFGGEQELGLRGGTSNVAAVVGFGKACELLMDKENDEYVTCASRRQSFLVQLASKLEPEEFKINFGGMAGAEKIVNIQFPGIDSEALVLLADNLGLCISAGAACSSNYTEPSHVLTAIGLDELEARSSVRFSFSSDNTYEEIVEAADIISDAIRSLKVAL